MAGLPQSRNLSAASNGERPNTYPIWVKFLKNQIQDFCSHFHFLGTNIATPFVYWEVLSVILKPPCEQEARPRNML